MIKWHRRSLFQSFSHFERRESPSSYNCKPHLEANQLHAPDDEEHQQSVFSANHRLQFLTRCGSLDSASATFQTMHLKNVFTWNIMLAAYAKNGHLLEAKRLFDKMPERTIVSWNTTLSGFSRQEDVHCTECFFRRMPSWDLFSTNITVAAYAQNGHLPRAKALFDNMPARDAVTWNTLVQAYALAGESSEAVVFLQRMAHHSVLVSIVMLAAQAQAGSVDKAMQTFQGMSERNVLAWNSITRASFESGNLELGNALFERMPQRDLFSWNVLLQHSDTVRVFEVMPGRDVVSWTTVLTFKSKNGLVDQSKSLFDRMPATNILSWTVIMTGYALRGDVNEAKDLFDELPSKDMVAWNSVVLAYVQAGQVERAEHAFSLAPKLNSASWNTLLQVHTGTGRMKEAKKLFDSLPRPDVISWNSLLGGYARTSHSATLACFSLMDLEGDVKPDKVTYLCILEACSLSPSAKLVDMRVLHEAVVSSEFSSDVSVSNALINLYVKCGDSPRALEAFRSISTPDVISWSCLIAAAAQDGELEQAKAVFQKMQLEGFKPTYITYISLLDACANSTNLVQGRALHSRIENGDCFEGDNSLSNSLLNMYSKCGRVDEAGRVFETIESKDLITWSSWISGLAWNGLAPASMHAFQVMLLEGTSPSPVTMLSILSACSHAGLVDVGLDYFRFMAEVGDVPPLLRHYECMVDMLSRAGRLEEAEELFDNMPFEGGSSSRMTILSSFHV